jgi:hypothetical protein
MQYNGAILVIGRGRKIFRPLAEQLVRKQMRALAIRQFFPGCTHAGQLPVGRHQRTIYRNAAHKKYRDHFFSKSLICIRTRRKQREAAQAKKLKT